MFRKKITRPIPKNAIRIAPDLVKARIKGRWVELPVNSSGMMVCESRRFYGYVRQPSGNLKAVPLTSERASSLQMLAQLQRRSERVSLGLEAPPAAGAECNSMELAEQWLNTLVTRGRASSYVSTARQRIFRLIAEGPFSTPAAVGNPSAGDVLAGFLERLRVGEPIKLPAGDHFTPGQLRALLAISGQALAKLATTRGITGSGQGKAKKYTRTEAMDLIRHRQTGCNSTTLNGYRGVFRAFAGWLVRRRIIEKVPVLPENEAAIRGQMRSRRALTWEECQRLALAAEESGRTINGLSPKSRSLLYRVAFRSLLRRRALRELTKADCHLDGPEPFLSVRPETDKTGRSRAIPIPLDLAQELSHHIAKHAPKGSVWPFKDCLAEMMRTDLRAAGIPPQTDEGVVDFHALRHSGATDCVKKGVQLDVVAKIGGWASTQLIYKTYGHYSTEHLRASVSKAWGEQS